MSEGGFFGKGMWLSLSSVKERLVAVGHWAEPQILGRLLHTLPFAIWRGVLPSLDSLLCRGSACSPGLRDPGLHCDAE